MIYRVIYRGGVVIYCGSGVVIYCVIYRGGVVIYCGGGVVIYCVIYCGGVVIYPSLSRRHPLSPTIWPWTLLSHNLWIHFHGFMISMPF